MAKKIVYFFGAGATHAEIQNLETSPSENFNSKNGLLISQVSRRVMQSAQLDESFKKGVEQVTYREGQNIELLISLFESNRLSDKKIKKLKDLVEEDIKKRLSTSRKSKFYLHKALFELHTKIEDKEELLGIISLNYDDVLDEAYRAIKTENPNYCLTSKRGDNVPLLKLHGSYNWDNLNIYGKKKNVSIIPLGIHKNYLAPPYNFIWGRALELLIECDILRVIGCSLNQNDIGIIDLLFKAHLERDHHFEIQIIDFQDQGAYAKNTFGFLPGITKPKDIEDALIADESILKNVGNPFRIWLKAKAERMLSDTVHQTKYLRKCL